jgi:3-deoxy-7-phosphoheptulonate synthase
LFAQPPERPLVLPAYRESIMLVVMQSHATPKQVEAVAERVREMGLDPHPMPGPTRTAIGITGNTGAVDPSFLEGLPGVLELLRVTKPYKLASREMHEADTTVQLPQTRFGPGGFTIIAGPCSVENEAMIFQTAEFLRQRGVKLLRAGAFKPRTSPYSFQGMQHEGLQLLKKVRDETGIGIVTEVMDAEQAEAVEDAADMLQIGARNIQNFTLLKRVGRCRKPVLLKRGISATLDEWLMAAEYLLAGGNMQVVLCERGVRTFADHTRNTLDLSVIPPVKQFSHLPVIADPSHGTGHRQYVPPMALAALAAGAHGLMVEVHPDPDHAASDGAQSLTFDQFDELLASLRKLAETLECEIR